MDMIVLDKQVNGSVKFDPGHLGSGKTPPYMNLINLIAYNRTECRPHAADNTGLLTMRNMIVADQVTTDGGFAPQLSRERTIT